MSSNLIAVAPSQTSSIGPVCHKPLLVMHQEFKKAGCINMHVVPCNLKAWNLALSTHVMVKTAHHDDIWIKRFSDGVLSILEIAEISQMA